MNIDSFALKPLAFAVSALAFVASARAEEAVAPEIYPAVAHGEGGLIEILVSTGSKEATRLQDTPAAIAVVGRQQLDDTQATRIDQVLNTVPGVHMADLANEQHAMSIRQPISTGAFYQYLEDGVAVRPLGVFNHNALNEVNLAGVEQVEVLRGPASSLYGSNAVGGAVNFLSREPADRTEAHIGIRGSDRGYRRVDVGGSIRQGDLGIRIEAYKARNETPWRTYNGFEKDALTVRVDKGVGAHSLLKTTFTYSYLDTDMPGSLSETLFRQNPRFSNQTFTYRQDKALRLTTALETIWNDKAVSTLTFYARKNDHGQNPSYSVAPCNNTNGLCAGSGSTTFQATGVVNNNAYTSLGVDAKWRQDFDKGRTRWISGVSLDRSPNQYTQDDIQIVRDPATGPSFNYVRFQQADYAGYTPAQKRLSKRRDYTVNILNPSLYSQLEFTPIANLRAVAGARYDYIRYDHKNVLTSEGFGAPNDEQSFKRLSPKLGAIYTVSPTVQIYSNASTGFTPPEVSSLYGALSVPDLDAATYRNVDVGLRYQSLSGHTRVEGTIYRLDGSKEVVSYTDAANNRYPVNSGKTRHQGLELGWHQHVVKNVEAHLNATYAKHEFIEYSPKAGTSFDGNIMPTAPRLVGSAELAWMPTLTLRTALELVRVGPYWMDEANTKKYEGYDLLNLRTQYKKGAWTLFLHGLNLQNRNYSTLSTVSFGSASYTPGEPRTVLAGVDYTFN